MKKASNEKIREVIKEQILAIRDSGKTNMFARTRVMKIANDLGYYELVYFITDHPKEYSEFILGGDETLLQP